MAEGMILLVMSISLVTAIFSSRTLVLEWRKAQRQLYGTMNFDGRSTRASKMQLLTHALICFVSLILLVSSFMMYQVIHFPLL